ncbi:MAG: hypothetical protein IJV40_01335 [Oscillospiraceae bacterium]|nr:hypothetical protein [Oscillospiraceae bacterium]
MRVITCASYYGTGSSAVTDLFSECGNIYSLGDYEYRFLQEPDGIADLEYNIVENNHRHNTSDAIKRFQRYMSNNWKMGYGGYKVFGTEYKALVEQYIDSLCELKTHTWWNKDRTDKGWLFCQADRAYSLLRRLTSGGLKSEEKYSLLQDREYGYYTAISEEIFLDRTRVFVDSLLRTVLPEEYSMIMVDQMIPPTNTDRYVRYFNDVRAIVVDRDPRDLYLLEKLKWKWGIIPTSNVEEFVKWFLITRKYSAPSFDSSGDVLRLKFEDLIYRYEPTVDLLFNFVGVKKEDHIYPRKYFNPQVSSHNTRLFENHIEYKKDIDYIEHYLNEYIYDYTKLELAEETK